MPVVAVVGAQWGDEGKGKVVDLLVEQADGVFRYCGGANAGHTMYFHGKKIVTHTMPSGLLQNKPCVLGVGMVIDPAQLIKEVEEFRQIALEQKTSIDLSPGQIKIARQAHIVLPSHMALDGAREKARSGKAIGTTGKGIGPTYSDKALRVGLRAEMMKHPAEFGKLVRALVREHNLELDMLGLGSAQLNPSQVGSMYESYANRLADYVQDTGRYLRQCLDEGKTILAEGAQGILLDVDYGGYPYVTSSSTLPAAAAIGCGASPKHIGRIIGVVKCYGTRVGGGPFPTEILDDENLVEHLRGMEGEPGYEAGATTGRLRRIGWLDLPVLRHAIAVSGIEELVPTKLDVLSGLKLVKICTGYRYRGKIYTELPENWTESMHEFVPDYKYLPGWPEGSIRNVRTFEDLPENARLYIRMIEEGVGPKVKVSMISVGPERDEIFTR